MNQPWKVVLVLVGIFIAGGVTGAFVMARVIREKVAHRPMPDQWAPMQLKRLTERLDLTPEQKEQLQPIVKRNMDELRKLRNSAMAETRTVFERMQREIQEKLTPEQRAKFDQMNREFRERARRFIQERQNRPPGGPGDPRFERDRRGGPDEEPKGETPPPEKPPGT
jgi:Spy/CpxP family protein refolding chaperone